MSDYITGDEMIELLVDEGGSEAATFAPGDDSIGAVLAKLAEWVLDGSVSQHPDIGARIDFGYDEERALHGAGYLTREGRLTSMGVAFIDGVVAKHGCTCSARDHRIMESRAALAALEN